MLKKHYYILPDDAFNATEQEDSDCKLTASFNLDFDLRKEAQLKPGSKIWVPGCGTRWAVLVALQFSDCEIVASDLSSSSIAFQTRLVENLGLTNIKFKQENLLETGYTDEFDFISCVGVLHHLQCPLDGFKAICRALKGTGWFAIFKIVNTLSKFWQSWIHKRPFPAMLALSWLYRFCMH